jgi:hypothetical protein
MYFTLYKLYCFPASARDDLRDDLSRPAVDKQQCGTDRPPTSLLVLELKAIVPEPAAMEAPTLRVAAAKMGSVILKKKHGQRHFLSDDDQTQEGEGASV